MTETTERPELTERRIAELRDAANHLWAWGWYDLAEKCMGEVRSAR